MLPTMSPTVTLGTVCVITSIPSNVVITSDASYAVIALAIAEALNVESGNVMAGNVTNLCNRPIGDPGRPLAMASVKRALIGDSTTPSLSAMTPLTAMKVLSNITKLVETTAQASGNTLTFSVVQQLSGETREKMILKIDLGKGFSCLLSFLYNIVMVLVAVAVVCYVRIVGTV